jgi:uncharacterized protein (DUF433 family)
VIRRRAVAAGITAPIGCHTFRATGITAYLANGGPLEHAQEMAAARKPAHHQALRPHAGTPHAGRGGEDQALTGATTSTARQRDLRRARRLAVSNPGIFGGDPVFRGTRVPVHLIAELVAQGSNPTELIEGYPRLTAEMIRLAPIYAAAYPLRVRPRKQPWLDQQPVCRRYRSLETIAMS